MATRRGSNKTQYISKGQRPNVSRWTRKACRRAYKADSLAVTLNKVDAWKKGKKVFVSHKVFNCNKKIHIKRSIIYRKREKMCIHVVYF